MGFFGDPTECNSEYYPEDEPAGSWPWYCTLPAGHAGDHEAHGVITRLTPIVSWPNTNN